MTMITIITLFLLTNLHNINVQLSFDDSIELVEKKMQKLELLNIKSAAYNYQIIYRQDFNIDIPTNDSGDLVWRIPSGWSSNDYSSTYPGALAYPTTQFGQSGDFIESNYLLINDYSAGSSTYIERPLPAIVNGSIEFWYTMYFYDDYSNRHDVILESSDGTDLLTFTTFKPVDPDEWRLSLEGQDSGLAFSTPLESLYVKINFDGTSANLSINGIEVLNDIGHTPGTIENLRITSDIDGVGQAKFDNFVLMEKKESFIPIRPQNVLYEQNFNSDIPTNDSGDLVWRIPTGWSSNDYSSTYPGALVYPTTQFGRSEDFTESNYLLIQDYSGVSSTYIERPLPAVDNGSLEFRYTMYFYNEYSNRHDVILESSDGTDLLTFTALKPVDPDEWTLSLEGQDSGLTFSNPLESLYVKINFNGATANLSINGIKILSDIGYTPGIVENIRITSDIGGIGQAKFDDFVVAGELIQIDLETETTNSIWQNLGAGNHYVECIDENEYLWIRLLIPSENDFDIRLTHQISNPTQIEAPLNSSLSHFYYIESENLNINKFNGNFYYLSEENLIPEGYELCVYKLKSENWEIVDTEHYQNENNFFIVGLEVNTHYAIGLKKIAETTAPLKISGFPIELLISNAIISFCLVLTKYWNKRRI